MNATGFKSGTDVTSTQGINLPNFQCWEIQDAPITSP